MRTFDGKFISISGGEGGGKTTQVNELKEWLPWEFQERDFVFTREPGGTPLAEEIRRIILSDRAAEASGKTMFHLFAAARMEHIERVILPALYAGKIVVCDRFIPETFAYQVETMRDPASMKSFRAHEYSIPFVPALEIILDVAPEIARARIERRLERMTHFDSRGPEFHEHLRKAFRKWARDMHPERTVLVNGNRPAEIVHKEIVGLIRSRVIEKPALHVVV